MEFEKILAPVEVAVNEVFMALVWSAGKVIEKGELFSSNNLTTLRSSIGISAAEWNKYIKINYEFFGQEAP